ncbi:SDR family oxidoreductase [Hymenobacter sp. BT664]|uniref:SDR family oxidoreductase n=1 Tax=Hymenobacter montanus TaxID=2771359 RepID=A0A927BEX9_9BACT|nr:SDR family oxidoreductase [Hymenobacter montanus]MBD2769005.1 SDR family oxidoreductase [Hymenobacter montanus]
MISLPKTVLITGASSGIGLAAARMFLAAGVTTYASARRVESLDELARLGARVLALDVTDDESMRRAIQLIEVETEGLDVLVNNAGYGQNGVLEELPLAELRRQFDTNVFGVVRLCQLVLPGMRRRGTGRIVITGSAGGDFSTPGAGAYCASKFALEALVDALRYEVQSFGVRVSLIKPGGVRTRFMEVADAGFPAPITGDPYQLFRKNFLAMTVRLFDAKSSFGILSPEDVGQVIFEAATVPVPKTRYRVGVLAKVMPRLRRLLSDRLWDRLMAAQVPIT